MSLAGGTYADSKLGTMPLPWPSVRVGRCMTVTFGEVIRGVVQTLDFGTVAERRQAAQALDAAGWAAASEGRALQTHLAKGEPDDKVRQHLESVLRRIAEAESRDRWEQEEFGMDRNAVVSGGSETTARRHSTSHVRGEGEGPRRPGSAVSSPQSSPEVPWLQNCASIAEAKASIKEALEQAMSNVSNPDLSVRRRALKVFVRLGEAAAPAAATVARHLNEDDVLTRTLALDALAAMGTAAAPHADLLLAQLAG